MHLTVCLLSIVLGDPNVWRLTFVSSLTQIRFDNLATRAIFTARHTGIYPGLAWIFVSLDKSYTGVRFTPV